MLCVCCLSQANPLSPSPSPFPLATTPLAAHRPLLVPMALRLSNLKLRAIVVLVVSKQKGITLVFKNDPLESLEVSSTFDSIGVLKGFIQREIEGQLREMFREDLPGIIHTLSQQWFTGEAQQATGATSVPFTSNLDVVARPSAGLQPPSSLDDHSPPSSPPSAHAVPEPLFPPIPIAQRTVPRRAPASSPSKRHLSPLSASPTSASTFPDLEQYDPTYGMRPEGVPAHSVVSGIGLGRRWERNRGLGHFVDGSTQPDEDGEADEADEGYELVGYEDDVEGGSRAGGSSYYDHTNEIDSTPPRKEYETIPAVGGGTITRPRVYLSQSFIRPPDSVGGGGSSSVWGGTGGGRDSPGSAAASGSTTTARLSTAPTLTRNGSEHWRSSSAAGLGISSPNLTPRAGMGVRRNTGSVGLGGSQPFAFPPPPASVGGRPSTPSFATPTRPKNTHHSMSSPAGQFPLHRTSHHASSSLNPSTSAQSLSSSNHTPPLSHSLSSAPSFSSNSLSTPASSSSSPPAPNHHRSPSHSQGLPEIISHLSMLSISNQTLSPYTREHAHVAVRSQPHIFRANTSSAPSSGGGDGSLPPPPGGGPRKARRKRMHRLGGGGGANGDRDKHGSSASSSMPATPSNSPPQHQAPSVPASSDWDYDSISVVGERRANAGRVAAVAASSAGGGRRREARPRLTPKQSYGFPSLMEEGTQVVPVPPGWDSGGFSGRFKTGSSKA